jgi:hypothetical protein
MKFIEDQYSVGSFLFNGIDVWHPHITAHPLELFGSIFSKEIKEFPKCLLAPSPTAPDQSLRFKIIYICNVFMPFPSGDLIDTDMRDARKISILQAILDNKVDRSGYCPPRTSKEPCYLKPRQQSRPDCEVTCKCISKPTLSGGPRNRLDVNPSTMMTKDTSWRIMQRNGYSPQRYMFKNPFRLGIPVFSWKTASPATRKKTTIRDNLNAYARDTARNRKNTKALQ